MSLFIIERNFAETLDPDAVDVVALGKVNDDCGVKWLYSFLSADRRKTYCLYEAGDAGAIRDAAQKAGLPADAVIELEGKLQPEALTG